MKTVGALLYIDPGTGAMLFSVLMGIVSAGFFMMQKLIMKAKFLLHGGKIKEKNSDKVPYVIFTDSKRYWNVFKPICDEFEKREIPIEYWTASPDDPALSEDYTYVKCSFIGEGNKAYAKLNLMNAYVCLATTPGLDVYQWKRSNNTDYYVHIVHDIGDTTLYRMFGIDYYDAVLLSGDFQGEDIRKLEKMRNLPSKEIIVVGSTYMDSMKKRAETLVKQKKARKVILAAPSWGDSSLLNLYGERFVQALIDTGYKVIIRPHPQTVISDPEMLHKLKEKFPENENFEWNADNDNFNVLNEADVMISDFSGVIFDFSLIFDKPIIYSDSDIDYSPYDAAWIDEPIWRKGVLPKLGIELKETDIDHIKILIDELLDSEEYQRERDYVRTVAWKNQGNAAVNTVDYLVEKYETIIRKENK